MKLFSKRNNNDGGRRDSTMRNTLSFRARQILAEELRNRIAAEISFTTSRNDFLEYFILFENQKKDKIYLDENKVNGFSLAELGYKMGDFFEFDDFAIKEFEYSDERPVRGPDGVIQRVEEKRSYFNDYILFDLIEFIILFCKKEKREEVTKRFNDIFQEEASGFEIINGAISKKTGKNITTIKNILKDQSLKQKIEDYAYYWDQENYLNTAKISAEIINQIFSTNAKNQKKEFIETTLKKLSHELSENKKNEEQFYQILNETLLVIKKFNNEIYNIRHTEDSAIKLKGGDFSVIYKMISEYNISFVEVILVSMQSDFIFYEDWENTKDNYIDKYQIDRNTRYVIKKPLSTIDDVPF